MGRENYMALIKCPKCGRENVSNSAERCPSCGYNIKEYYDKSHEKDNENKRIVLGIGIVILVFAVLFLKKESFTTHDADPFKKYYSNFGKDISTVNKSKKYIISSTSDHKGMLVNNSVKIWNIDGKLLLVANDQDDDELGLLIWSAENVELDNTQLNHIIEKMDKLYGKNTYHYDIENDLKVYNWDELSNMKIELFYRPCIKTMMISFSTNE